MPTLCRLGGFVDLEVYSQIACIITAVFISEMEQGVRQNSSVIAQAAETKYLAE